MFNIIKILFFIFIAYMIYNLIKAVLFLGRSAGGRRNTTGNGDTRQGRERSSFNDKKPEEKDQVIELDKDQYKVE